MKKTELFKIVIGAFAVLAALTPNQGCKKKKAVLEGELFTAVKIICTDSLTSKSDTFIWSDPDGAGGSNPQRTDSIVLDSGHFYNVHLQFFVTSGNDLVDKTEEIQEESQSHFLCFEKNATALDITYTDSDGKYPVGLKTKWQAKQKAKTSLRLLLRHQPGVKDGTCDPGDSDVDITLALIIQ